MTVRALLDAYTDLEEVTFVKGFHDERIFFHEEGTYKAIRKHYDEEVAKITSAGKNRIEILLK